MAMNNSPTPDPQRIALLQQENKTLSQQVKRLIKAESKLYDYQEKLDVQLGEYKKLYELNRNISTIFELEMIFAASTEYVIYNLAYERVVFLRQYEQGESFRVCTLDGFYDPAERAAVAEVCLQWQEPGLQALRNGREYLICKTEEEDQAGLRGRFLMREYLLYPLGPTAKPHALIAVGNSSENAEFYRAISAEKDALLGMGNLVGLLSSRVENYLFYSNMEKALAKEKRAEAKYRGIFENAAEGIVQISHAGRILSSNPAAAQILGYDSPAEFIASITDVGSQLYVQPQLREQLFQRFEAGETVANTDLEFYGKDGNQHWVQLSVRPVCDVGGKIQYTDTLILDIAERKRAQQALQEINEELEQRVICRTSELENAISELKNAQSRILQQEKMASIGQLAAGVAHEINNPMGFIISNLSTFSKYVDKLKTVLQLQDDALDRFTADGAAAEAIAALRQQQKQLKIKYVLDDLDDLLAESMDGAERVKHIVQNLKSFSRLDEEEFKTSDINEGLDSTINIVWNEIKYKAELHRDYGALPAIYCNLSQLNQVFMNLLVNAAQAIEAKGEIWVKTWSDAANLYISVSDNGAGIAPDKLGKIFEPFFTTKDVGKGTGLGLSIAYEIIKNHQGELQVESMPGERTSFTVSLPIAAAPEVVQPGNSS